MSLKLFYLCLVSILSAYGDLAPVQQNPPLQQTLNFNQNQGVPNRLPAPPHGQVPGLMANMSQILGGNSLPTPQGLATDGAFTVWTTWSKCPEQCGRTALRSRERYCTNPPPSNGGKNCQGARFQLKLCQIQGCPEATSFKEWSKWSKCSKPCGGGVRKRTRECSSEKGCKGKNVEKRHCNSKPCASGSLSDDSSIVDVDPQTVCGYNPCDVAKCSAVPYATCVSDFKCQPIFFDADDKKIHECAGDNLYLNVAPESVCRFNPCHYSTCLLGSAAKCVVNTKCHPVYLGAFGKKVNCNAVLKVPAKPVCGMDPCEDVMCKDNPSAKCLVNHKCKPVFIDPIRQKIHHCSKGNRVIKSDDAEEEAEDDADDESDEKESKDATEHADEEEDEEEETADDTDTGLGNQATETANQDQRDQAVLEKYTATAADSVGKNMEYKVAEKTENEAEEDEDDAAKTDDEDSDEDDTDSDDDAASKTDDEETDVIEKLKLLRQRMKGKHSKHKKMSALKRVSIDSIATGTGSSILDNLLHVGEGLRHEHEHRVHHNSRKKQKIVYI